MSLVKRPALKTLICTSDAGSDVDLPLTKVLMNMTGLDKICIAFQWGYSNKEFDKEMSAQAGTTLKYISSLPHEDKIRIYEAKRDFAESKLEGLRRLTMGDIDYQYDVRDVDAQGVEIPEDELMLKQVKRATLVEKRIKNNDLSIKSWQRTIERLDRLIMADQKNTDEGLVIEHSVTISQNALSYLPE